MSHGFRRETQAWEMDLPRNGTGFNAPRGRVALAVVAACVVTLSAVTGCSDQQQGEGPGHRQQPLAISPQQELETGRAAYREILAKSQVVRGGPQVERVERVGKRIAAVIAIEPLMREINLHVEPSEFEWEYSVLKNDQINAFCLPGGKICVFTGLLAVAGNDDQLAAVLSHEISHALAHHVSERMARERTVGHGLLSLSYDRQQESEADHIGIFLMTFAGYDPDQALVFWREMEAAAGRAAIPEILSDHPSDARRLEQLQNWIPLAKAAKKAYDEHRIAPVGNR
jgi:predicted Zn-dependent protease